MSGAPNDDTPSGWDILAGEYVLGLLEAAFSVEQRARAEPALAAAIARWQTNLDPLADLAPPVPPSDLLWQRIAKDLPRPAKAAPPPPPPSNAWRGIALASLALAAGLAAFIIWTNTTRQAVAPWPRAVALLSAPGSAEATLRAQVTGAGTITVVPLRHLDVGAGRQLGFWAWPASEKAPVLLGMMSPAGGQLRFPYPPREGTPVMVTSEPAGAQPHNSPGPTLFLGLLVANPA
jgi:anti-sigma-K factor RskA